MTNQFEERATTPDQKTPMPSRETTNERLSDEEAELAELEYIKQKYGKNGFAALLIMF